jgi:hypothetical protein
VARRLALVLSLLVAAAGTTSGAPADFCQQDALAAKKTDPAAYDRRPAGYCDGSVYRPQVGSGELAVIGVSVPPIKGDPGKRPISIVALLPDDFAHLVSWPLQVQGVALSPRVNYRLDAALGLTAPLRIGTESAMRRLIPILTADGVAWSAWDDSPTHGRIYVPVAAGDTASGAVEITVRPTIYTAYVRFSVLDAARNRVAPEKTVARGTDPGDPVSFTLPSGPEHVVVNVVAVGNAGDTQAAAIRVIRRSSPAP